MRLKRFENFRADKDLIVCCDIQKEYEKWISFIPNFVNYINYNGDKTIIFLYNGESVGHSSVLEYKDWLISIGIDPEIIEDSWVYDKGYGQIRELMDTGIEHDKIIDLIRLMLDKNIGDSRELSDSEWESLGINYTNTGFGINEVVEFLAEYDDFILIGGGKNECLLEVELFLTAINKTWTVDKRFVY